MATEEGERTSTPPKDTPERVTAIGVNKFSNDGSFLEMFKKKMEEQKILTDQAKTSEKTSKPDAIISADKDADSQDSATEASASNSDSSVKKPNFYAFVGKRRGGAPVLKTGAVKKQKKDEETQNAADAKDAWARYLQEVQKYKSQSCQEEDKTRPLVK